VGLERRTLVNEESIHGYFQQQAASAGVVVLLLIEKKSEAEIGERSIEFLDTIDPGTSKSFKCFSEDVFMAKTITTDAIINLYHILDAPAKGLTVGFDIDNLSENDSIVRARTYEFMKGFELGYRGGHAKGLEDGLSPTATTGVQNAEGRTVMTSEKSEL